MEMSEVIVVEKLCKSYGKSKILKDMSFFVEEGKIFGLLGPNGTGKSTLIKIISRTLKADSGRILLFGKPVEAHGSKIYDLLAIVPQEECFYRAFSVKHNLEFFGMLHNLKGKKLKGRVGFLLEWLNLAKFKDRKAEDLSGGYRRLLNTACSLIHDPKLIILDEPTVGLDPKMRSLFWEKITQLKEAGKTVVITTHYMDEAENLCDIIAIAFAGNILVQGKPTEIVKKYAGPVVMGLQLDRGLDEITLNELKACVKNIDVSSSGKFIAVSFPQSIESDISYKVMEFLREKSVKIMGSTIKEPELEDAFLKITGQRREVVA